MVVNPSRVPSLEIKLYHRQECTGNRGVHINFSILLSSRHPLGVLERIPEIRSVGATTVQKILIINDTDHLIRKLSRDRM